MPVPIPAPRPIPAPKKDGVPEVRDNQDEETAEEQLTKTLMKVSPPVLVSLVVHMVGIIILGIWMIQQHNNENIIHLNFADTLGDQLSNDSMMPSNSDLEEAVIVESNQPIVENPFSPPPSVTVASPNSTSDALSAALADKIGGLGLEGRNDGARDALRGKYGGDKLTDAAVSNALKWLARQQQKDGTWSLMGPYTSGATSENVESATAMALLAFQGNGNTHQKGQYKANVAAGMKAMLRMQDGKGNFFHGGRSHDSLYTQAQCTIFICELYGMSKDPALKAPAELALLYCLEAQHELGGWRYSPKSDSDTSVTGWMVMALQSAKMAGLLVPSSNLDLINSYLDKAAVNGGSEYGYMPGQGSTPAMTAEGLLCRQYLGWKQDDKRLTTGADYLLTQLPDWKDRDMYFWYYATQTMHHMEGNWWHQWNNAFKGMLTEHQVSVGAENGSWDPLGDSPDLWAVRGQGGRLYVTCLSVYMLEVYYRHLPIYSKMRKQFASN